MAQVDTTGLIGTAFTHRDSRAGDPDLHTHVAISNKVATIDANGVQRWLALDGQPLHRVMVAVSELYNTRLEAHLGQRLGLQFTEMTPPGRGKRPIREIIGVNTELNTRWSSRRQAIEARTAELSKQFQADHGREPTNVEAIALAQQATLESREAKHEPRSLAEQRQTWRAEAIEVLGGRHQLTQMIGQALSTRRHHTLTPATPEWISTQGEKAITTVAMTRSTWQRHHVLAEAQRIVRSTGHAADDTLAQRITAAALAEPISLPLARIDDGDMGEPAALRRRDGSSVYTRTRNRPLHQRRDPLGRAAHPARRHPRRGPHRRQTRTSRSRSRTPLPAARTSTLARLPWSPKWPPTAAASRLHSPRPAQERPPPWPRCRTPGATPAAPCSAWLRPRRPRSISART